MGYRVRQYHKSTEQKIVEGFFKSLWWLISLPFKLVFGKRSVAQMGQTESLDPNFVASKWKEIEELMRLGRPSNYARAVLESDKLLDHILKGLNAPGPTMGDRLKASKNRFSPEGLDAAWRGHKVRNEIVHSSEYQITDFMAREAIGNFKKAIGELIRF
ncbi:MAG TPA: hypothetical protein VJK26_03720 [Patescibacteria group bacterium]|nr:hypothetical protein [Patescibacteria group bacterium]